MAFRIHTAKERAVGIRYGLKVLVLTGLALSLNMTAVSAGQKVRSPQLTCSIPSQGQKGKGIVSNLDPIPVKIKLTKVGDKPFQKLWIPLNKKDWMSRMLGVNKKKAPTSLDSKQTVFIQVLSVSNKKSIPFTVTTSGRGQRSYEETVSLFLEIPLDAKSKQAKVDEFFKRIDQRRVGASGNTPEISPKDKYNRFKAKNFLMNSMLENRVGKFIINCKYVADQDKFWKGQLIADPLIVEVENKGSFWDRISADKKEAAIGELPPKPKPTEPKVDLNELGKELEQLAYRFPDPPGKADLPKVIEGLTDAESSTRQMALRVLIQIITHNRALEIQGHEKEVDLNQHPKVLTSLLKMVRDQNPKNRTGAIVILSSGFQSSGKIQMAIFEQMKTEVSKEVKMTVLGFIQHAGQIPKQYQSILIDTLNSKDKGLSRNAAHTMGAIKMESGLPLLIEKFKTSEIEGNFETYYRAIYFYKKEAKPYLPVLESRMKEVDDVLKSADSKKDKRKILFIKSGLQDVIDRIRKSQ